MGWKDLKDCTVNINAGNRTRQLKAMSFWDKNQGPLISLDKKINTSHTSQLEGPYDNYFSNTIILIPNHKLLNEQKIPACYKDIHSLVISHFKQLPINTVDTLTQSLWLNQHITLNRKPLYWKAWERLGFLQINDNLNEHNQVLSHHDLVNK